jgi:3-oxoacyl-[acyl-carrier protein] reductase
MPLLQGKTVLVTAAAGTGIGYATAERCQEEGATVVISDRHERRLAEAAERLGVASIPCDVTQEDQVQALIDQVRPDVLINNAGLGAYSQLVDLDDALWDKVMSVTLTGTMRCMRAAMRVMIPRGSGVIVNNASVLGWRAQEGQAAYAAAKAGVMALTRCAAMEGAPHGVRINAVAPSLAMHPFLERVTPPGLLEKLSQQEAFGRAATPREIADIILFLASDLSSYLTGEVISASSQRA